MHQSLLKECVCIACFGLIAFTGQSQERSKEDIDRDKKFQELAATAGRDTSKNYRWTHNVVTGVNLTQISFKDWVQGGENALAYTLWLRGNSVQDQERTNWNTSYRFAFGQTRLGNQGLRKTDDEIFIQGLLIYKLGVNIDPYAGLTFRTQFAKGYHFDDQGNQSDVSAFFDPGYLMQSAGVGYKPVPEFSTRMGLAAREVITSQFTNFADDPTTSEIEKTRIEGGLESVTEIGWKFAENMMFSSKLEIFAPFKTIDRMVVRSDNSISAIVNTYVTTSLNVQFINDPVASPLTQIKEVLALGLSYTLF